ncbi:hypothetical protein B0H13DRAFT_2665945 [Mycena leptocephala]|nr:hypothetical protein B0H13DRAFT_2665945 [Mycena leptocephala]
MKLASTLVAMLFVAVAAAVPTEVLKREPSSPLASGIIHCNAKCVAVDCGDLPVAFRDCFGTPCACVDS